MTVWLPQWSSPEGLLHVNEPFRRRRRQLIYSRILTSQRMIAEIGKYQRQEADLKVVLSRRRLMTCKTTDAIEPNWNCGQVVCCCSTGLALSFAKTHRNSTCQAKYMTRKVSGWTEIARAMAAKLRSSLLPEYWLPSPLKTRKTNHSSGLL